MTSSSFVATYADPPRNPTPAGTATGTAAPGLLDVLYHVDNLLGNDSLPDVFRTEAVAYDFALAPFSPVDVFDPDEFQVRGFIQAGLDWTLPTPTVGSAQVFQNADIEWLLKSAGSTIAGLRLLHARRIDATGLVWDPVDEDITITLHFSGGTSTTIAYPLASGNFVVDRSVSRGTTQLWIDGNLVFDTTTTTPRTAGTLTFVVDRADGQVQDIAIPDLTMAESHIILSGVRLCPSGTAISDLTPFANQWVIGERAGIGDGVTTVYATTYAYIANSLRVDVASILSEADPTGDQAFTLVDPAPVGAPVTVTYMASGL